MKQTLFGPIGGRDNEGQTNRPLGGQRGEGRHIPQVHPGHRSGLSPYETAQRLHALIRSSNRYASRRKKQYRALASAVKLTTLGLSAASTVILGLQDLDFWAGLGFALVALTTVTSAIEPYFNWRSRWVLMEEGQHLFYTLQQDLEYLISKTPEAEFSQGRLDETYADYQAIWESLSRRWLEHRQRESGA
jgi:hypothetical protein